MVIKSGGEEIRGVPKTVVREVGEPTTFLQHSVRELHKWMVVCKIYCETFDVFTRILHWRQETPQILSLPWHFYFQNQIKRHSERHQGLTLPIETTQAKACARSHYNSTVQSALEKLMITQISVSKTLFLGETPKIIFHIPRRLLAHGDYCNISN